MAALFYTESENEKEATNGAAAENGNQEFNDLKTVISVIVDELCVRLKDNNKGLRAATFVDMFGLNSHLDVMSKTSKSKHENVNNLLQRVGTLLSNKLNVEGGGVLEGSHSAHLVPAGATGKLLMTF